MFEASHFFDLTQFEHAAIFNDTVPVWEVLSRIGNYIDERFQNDMVSNIALLKAHHSTVFGEQSIFVGEGTSIHPSVYIEGPAIIGRNCEIRQGAYIRSNVLIGDNCVIGHCTEVKNSILFDDAKAPHFNYVGDSILGNDTNLGAGTKLSNLGMSGTKTSTIVLSVDDEKYDTQLVKFGAIIGDRSETGCNVVTNPGVLIGPETLIYPMVSLKKGYYPPRSIIKLRQTVEIVERH